MAITPLRMLMLFGGASGAAVGTAYTLGAFDPPPAPPQAALSMPAPVAEQKTPEPQQVAAVPTVEPPAVVAPAGPILPGFDLVRAEPDGSVVIAGKAAPDANVEIIIDGKVIARAKATAEGDFVAVLDEPLKPGDYQISLRAVTSTGVTAASKEAALVSIPETPGGQVLAMVEEAGTASRILARPEPAVAASPAPAPGAPAKMPSPLPDEAAAVSPPAETAVAAKPAEPVASPPAPGVSVEAVEIEGAKMFVAGAAPAGATVRVYANDQLLGETRATPEGRFLLEIQRDLAVGDYKVRADAIGRDGKDVLARAEVDFTREPGESVAAVAPAQPAPAPAQPAAAAPPQVAAAPAVEPARLTAASGGVIIRRGDSLWRISRRVYGQGVRFSTIYLANDVQIRDPNRIYPGQVFRVPEKTEEGETADMTILGEQATTIQQ